MRKKKGKGTKLVKKERRRYKTREKRQEKMQNSGKKTREDTKLGKKDKLRRKR